MEANSKSSWAQSIGMLSTCADTEKKGKAEPDGPGSFMQSGNYSSVFHVLDRLKTLYVCCYLLHMLECVIYVF